MDVPVEHFTMRWTSESDSSSDFSEPDDKPEDSTKSEVDVNMWPPSVLFHNGCPLLNHRGIVRTLWDIIVNLATLYIAIIVPYEITFMRANLANRPTLVLDIVMEVFFVLDILVNFRTSYEVEEIVVADSRSICLRYVKSWLLIDIIAATPLDLLHVFNIHVVDTVHLMKTVRLVRLWRLIKKLEKYSANSTLVLSVLMFSFTLIAHWAACVWYEIGLFDLRTPHWHVGWLAQMAVRLERPYSANRTGGLSEADAYTGAIYYTVSSMTTVGFGNISPNTKPEKMFATCLMLSGALMHALIFGNVSAIIYRLYAGLSNFHIRMNELNNFITESQFPVDLSRSMRRYATKTWASHGIKHHVLLQDFPEDIYVKIHLHLFRQILNLSLFKRTEDRVKKELALHVSASTHRHGDIFINKDEVVQALHMVSSGALHPQTGHMQGPGCLIGTWQMKKRPMSCERVLVVGDCTVHSLSLEALQRVFDLFPRWSRVFYRELRAHLDHDICPMNTDNFVDCNTDSTTSV